MVHASVAVCAKCSTSSASTQKHPTAVFSIFKSQLFTIHFSLFTPIFGLPTSNPLFTPTSSNSHIFKFSNLHISKFPHCLIAESSHCQIPSFSNSHIPKFSNSHILKFTLSLYIQSKLTTNQPSFFLRLFFFLLLVH